MLKCPGIFFFGLDPQWRFYKAKRLKELATLNFNHYIEHYILPSLVGNHKVTSSKFRSTQSGAFIAKRRKNVQCYKFKAIHDSAL